MNGRGHSLFPMVVLTLLAGVSMWLDRVTQQPAATRAEKIHEADFSADKLTVRNPYRGAPQGRPPCPQHRRGYHRRFPDRG